MITVGISNVPSTTSVGKTFGRIWPGDTVKKHHMRSRQLVGSRQQFSDARVRRPGGLVREEVAAESGDLLLCRYFFGVMLTIHCTPNLSVHMPNVSPQGALASGMIVVPPATSFSK